MRIVKSFSEYINEAWKDVKSDVPKTVAGLCIVYDNKMLLVKHGKKGTLGIPKGEADEGEDLLDAAIRETQEETGIRVNKSKIKPDPYVVDVHDEGSIKKQIVYFLVQVVNPNEIGINSDILSKDKLDLSEISWAGFVNPNDAYPNISRNQLIILDRHLNV